MSYLNEICCPDHPDVTLIEDYGAGNMVCSLLVFYLLFYSFYKSFLLYISLFVISFKFYK